MVADWSGSLLAWEAELGRLKDQMGSVFPRVELRRTAGLFIDGLLSGVERKTGWLMAEAAGLERPYRMQSLLGRSQWSAEALRDWVRDYALAALGDPEGVLVVDETGFVKKGEHSVGAARQYTGTAGRIENAQVGVFLAYASRFGQTLIDRRLYLPESWANDEERRAGAYVPEAIGFATKVEMARDLIAAALDAGAPCRWVLADAVYGVDSGLRQMLEARRQPYALAVRSNQPVRAWTQRRGFVDATAASLAADLSAESFVRLSAGQGSKGLKLSNWARVALAWPTEEGFERWLLIRRSLAEGDKQAYYLVFAPKGATLAELAGVAGLRWTIEECFERAKGDLGLDHCEARSWHGWHRHMTLVMAAAAFLAKLAADLRRSAFDPAKDKANERSPQSLPAV
jgi:SRSO17 transposase